jgi:hypothetical protein
MAENRSDMVWEHWYRASEKFDYFMAGLSSALTAFDAQSLEKVRPGLNAAGLQAVSAVLLCGAVAVSLDRLRYNVAGLSANHQKLYHSQRRGSLVAGLMKSGPGVLVNTETGEAFSAADAHKAVAYHDNALAQIEPQAARFKKRSEAGYKIRDWLLISGLAVYVASQIWKAFS